MPPFAKAKIVLARGPFTVEDERSLLKDHQIDTIVCKNSGGSATDAKLTAAQELGVQVIMLDRPARPDVPKVASVGHAVTWLYGRGLINQGP
jgi:precorrin-6A/cobalt-precorrin-6A reductase